MKCVPGDCSLARLRGWSPGCHSCAVWFWGRRECWLKSSGEGSGKGKLEVVRLLLELGAHANAVRNYTGFTALLLASQGGHLEVVRELVTRGANVNLANPQDHLTPLMGASMGGHLGIVRFLLLKGAVKSARIGNLNAYEAASGPHKDAIQALLGGPRR